MISSFSAGLGPIGKALGWMIIHSLWQISLIALVLALILRMVPRKQVNTRYAFLLIGLVAVVCWSGMTFQANWAYYAHMPTAEQGTAVVQNGSSIEAPNFEPVAYSWEQSFQQTVTWLDSQLNRVTFIWGIGVVLSCLYFILGLSYLHYLQTYRVKMPEPDWAERFSRLCTQMGIRRKVQFLLSEVVQDPITFRLLRPVILLPTSLMTGLEPKQIELLLLHELAHIRRYDFTVNILQTLVEIVFFYHPALWWISRNIRTTREHCCDDAVLAVQNQPVLYAEALTRIPTSNFSLKNKLAMSANNNKGILSQRIFRLFGQYESQPPIYRSILMVFLLLFLSLGSQAFLVAEGSAPKVEELSTTTSAMPETAVMPEAVAQIEPATIVEAATEPTQVPSQAAPLPATPPTIEGTVLDEKGNALIGVSILVKNTTVGTITDFNGQFKLQLPTDCATLVFSYVGRKSKEVEQSCGGQKLDVVLPATVELGEVVVVGKQEEPENTREEQPAKEVIITGTVTDEKGQALIGTNVLIKDARVGTITDLEGNYRLALPTECATLVFSYIGKQTQEVANTCGSQRLDIILQDKKEAAQQESTPGIRLPEAEITTLESKTLQDLSLFPNPSSGTITVSFTLAKATKVIIGVYTMDGKLLTQNVLGLGAGTHRHVWHDDETRKGTFLLRIQTNGEKISKQFILE